ncbi:MAG: hypothetical protein IKV68_03130 [Oscillospiraceae bacterium]|nr:hypothetical protein [Oscillospiraceae bacterium]
MKQLRRILVCLLVALVIASTTACSIVDSALEDSMANLVQGNLDCIYLGKVTKDYAESVNSTVDECLADYKTGLEMEAEYFANYFDIEYYTDDVKTKLIDLYREIYSHSSFTVGAASRLDDTIIVVKVDIKPIDIFAQLTDQSDVLLADFYNKYTQDVVDAMTDAEYQAYDKEWAETLISACKKLLPNVGYEESVSLAVQVILQDDAWVIADESMGDIDTEIIYYP